MGWDLDTWYKKLKGSGAYEDESPVRSEKTTPAKVEAPKAVLGQQYHLISDYQDPWDAKPPVVVKVLDVQAGWVRYAHVNTTMFQDNRLEEATFMRVYTPVGEILPDPPKKRLRITP